MELWKNELRRKINGKQWIDAIEFMKEIIYNNPESEDAYLNMIYLLEHVALETNAEESLQEQCMKALPGIYRESLHKFSGSASFLFYLGYITVWCCWIYGISDEDAMRMVDKAYEMEPSNKLYRFSIYQRLQGDYSEIQKYAIDILNDRESISTIEALGPVGDYRIDCLKGWKNRPI